MTMWVIDYLAKWGHFLAGITWIGLLYYFNFVQAEYFKEADADARTDAFVKLAPRALWWFRWGAMLTLITGLIMLLYRHPGWTVDIVIGSVMAILMFLNVWLIIWPNQKILIASNEQLKGGGEALPEAAAAAPKAALASRTNVLFSIPMLYFMGSTSAPDMSNGLMSDNMTALIVILIIIAALELNAIFGKPGPMASIKGVITSGFVLWAVLLGLLLILPESSAPAAEPTTVEPAPAVETAPAMPAEEPPPMEPPPMMEAAPMEEPAATDAAAPSGEAAAGEEAAAMDEAAPAPEAAPPPAADPVADPDPTG